VLIKDTLHFAKLCADVDGGISVVSTLQLPVIKYNPAGRVVSVVGGVAPLLTLTLVLLIADVGVQGSRLVELTEVSKPSLPKTEGLKLIADARDIIY
jgi:hypothetical protein